ncbi:hypothetical protein RR48_03996 [Papilio machaon]|uniref:Uncharacterized protein n=1 Tax=Papilio machaon TaxID=76193 RepID=A0A0N0PDS6_PAPMA|nr:hypothetical protein RR48_03996 [Papilio machaon]
MIALKICVAPGLAHFHFVHAHGTLAELKSAFHDNNSIETSAMSRTRKWRQVRGCAGARVRGCAGARVCGCAGARVCGCAGARVRGAARATHREWVAASSSHLAGSSTPVLFALVQECNRI